MDSEHLAEGKCFICYKYKTRSIDRIEAVSSSNSGKDAGNEDKVLRKQLLTIFLLKKLFNIPEETCCQFLQQYGNPSTWISWCDSCSVFVDEAKNLFDQIKILERGMDRIKNNLEAQINSSLTYELYSTEANTFNDDPTKIVRKLIIQDMLRDMGNSSVVAKREIDLEYSMEEDASNMSFCGDIFDENESMESIEIKDLLPPVENISLNLEEARESTMKESNLKNVNGRNVNKKKSSVPNSKNTFQDCRLCGKNFPTEKETFQHLLSHPPPCPYCEEQLLHEEEFKTHIRTHKGEEMKRPKCSVCCKSFGSYFGVLNHRCDQEIKRDQKKRRLKERSVSTSSDESFYNCRRCEATFKNQEDLKIHRKIHSKRFYCTSCPKSFNRNWRLQDHILTHTDSSGKPFKCSSCKKAFTYKRALIQHENVHKEDNPFRCTVCSKNLTSTQTLAFHMESHSGQEKKRPFACAICEKTFTSLSGVRCHEKLHTGEKPHACKFCDMRFAIKSNLVDHERTHSDVKPFECPFCKERFKYKIRFNRHVLTHTKEPAKHKCSSCDKTFQQQNELKLHERTHTGEKPYLCTICGLRSAKAGSLSKHIKIVHDKVPGKFPCTLCDKRFHGRVDLQRHGKMHKEIN